MGSKYWHASQDKKSFDVGANLFIGNLDPISIFVDVDEKILYDTFSAFGVIASNPKIDAVVYLVDAYDKERFAESKKELDALLTNESLANVPFLVLGNKLDIPYSASEDELRYNVGLTNFTTRKGRVNLAGTNVRPLEVFMCSIVRKMGYGEGFKWVSQYIE